MGGEVTDTILNMGLPTHTVGNKQAKLLLYLNGNSNCFTPLKKKMLEESREYLVFYTRRESGGGGCKNRREGMNGIKC